jgi:hypothetical protein
MEEVIEGKDYRQAAAIHVGPACLAYNRQWTTFPCTIVILKTGQLFLQSVAKSFHSMLMLYRRIVLCSQLG